MDMCILVLLMLMTATQVGAIEATVGLSGIMVLYLKVLTAV